MNNYNNNMMKGNLRLGRITYWRFSRFILLIVILFFAYMTSYIHQIIGGGKQYVDFMIWVVFIYIYIVLEKKDCWKFEDDYTYFISPDTFMLIGLRENMYAVNKIKKLVYREIRYGGRILDTVAYEVVFEYEGKVVKLQSFFDGNWYESDMARFYKFLNDVIAEK